MKMPFMLQRVMGDKDAIDRGMEEVKGKIEDLIHQYHDIDMPIICASLKLIVSALEASPIMGEPGRALEESILKNVTAVAIVSPAKKEDA